MTRRTAVLFWGALAASVFFLGSAWTAAGALSGPHGVANAIVLVVAGGGCLAAGLVAGRIALVIGRAQRKRPLLSCTRRRCQPCRTLANDSP